MKNLYLLGVVALLSAGCITNRHAAAARVGKPPFPVQRDTLTLFDQARNRKVPIARYSPRTARRIPNQKLVIVSHGYGQNRGDSYLNYSFLTEHLA